MRRIALLLLGVGAAACASSLPSARSVALEFVSGDEPAAAFRQLGEEVSLDQTILDAMRAETGRRGETLLAVTRLPRGIHPYSVFAFIQRGDRIDVVETAMFWGQIQEKRQGVVASAELEALVTLATAKFDCTPGLAPEALFGGALIHWPPGAQVTCDAGAFNDASALLAERLASISDAAQRTYAMRE